MFGNLFTAYTISQMRPNPGVSEDHCALEDLSPHSDGLFIARKFLPVAPYASLPLMPLFPEALCGCAHMHICTHAAYV